MVEKRVGGCAIRTVDFVQGGQGTSSDSFALECEAETAAEARGCVPQNDI